MHFEKMTKSLAPFLRSPRLSLLVLTVLLALLVPQLSWAQAAPSSPEQLTFAAKVINESFDLLLNPVEAMQGTFAAAAMYLASTLFMLELAIFGIKSMKASGGGLETFAGGLTWRVAVAVLVGAVIQYGMLGMLVDMLSSVVAGPLSIGGLVETGFKSAWALITGAITVSAELEPYSPGGAMSLLSGFSFDFLGAYLVWLVYTVFLLGVSAFAAGLSLLSFFVQALELVLLRLEVLFGLGLAYMTFAGTLNSHTKGLGQSATNYAINLGLKLLVVSAIMLTFSTVFGTIGDNTLANLKAAIPAEVLAYEDGKVVGIKAVDVSWKNYWAWTAGVTAQWFVLPVFAFAMLMFTRRIPEILSSITSGGLTFSVGNDGPGAGGGGGSGGGSGSPQASGQGGGSGGGGMGGGASSLGAPGIASAMGQASGASPSRDSGILNREFPAAGAAAAIPGFTGGDSAGAQKALQALGGAVAGPMGAAAVGAAAAVGSAAEGAGSGQGGAGPGGATKNAETAAAAGLPGAAVKDAFAGDMSKSERAQSGAPLGEDAMRALMGGPDEGFRARQQASQAEAPAGAGAADGGFGTATSGASSAASPLGDVPMSPTAQGADPLGAANKGAADIERGAFVPPAQAAAASHQQSAGAQQDSARQRPSSLEWLGSTLTSEVRKASRGAGVGNGFSLSGSDD